jgi:23S rRNA (adenine2503-C2)-methyltransferase
VDLGLSRYDATRDDLAALLEDEPAYRVRQVWDGLHARVLAPAEMTDLPVALRDRVTSALPLALEPARESVSDDGDTVKWLWRLRDGALVETVLMHYEGPDGEPGRTTVCVSSQAGCAMACGFCATGQAGFERHLTTGEIVEQVVHAIGRARARTPSRRVGNIVLMGMGEPMANYDNVWAAVHRLHDDIGISARHLTLSTVGIIPGIRRLAADDLPINLAVSLHAANDELRDQLVPINRRYPIRDLMAACADYFAATRRRVSFEWALIAGVNDRPSDARELTALANELGAHVNLIPLNPTPGYATPGTPPDGVRRFRDAVRGLGVNVTVRQNRGTEIDAACGQLAGAGDPVSVVAPSRRPRSERDERTSGR